MGSRTLQLHLFTVQALLGALLLPWFDALRDDRPATGFFSVTSRLSYSMYLWHVLVFVFVNRTLGAMGVFKEVYDNAFLLYFIYFVLIYFVAWVSYHRIEQPFLALRDAPVTWRAVCRAAWFSGAVVAALIFVF